MEYLRRDPASNNRSVYRWFDGHGGNKEVGELVPGEVEEITAQTVRIQAPFNVLDD